MPSPPASVQPPVSPAVRRRRPRPIALGTAVLILALLVAGALFLAYFDWNKAREPLARFASDRTGRAIIIAGDLDIHALSWRPTATLNGLSIGDPAWAGDGKTVEIGRLSVQVKLLPLLVGRVEPVRIVADRPVLALIRDAQGRTNWDFSNGRKTGRPLRLPALQQLAINEGRISVVDAPRGLRLAARISANEQLGGAKRGFHLTGDGAVNGAPFKLALDGGPLLSNRPGKPYPFSGDLRAGATHIAAKGRFPKPFDFNRLDVEVEAEGQDLAALYPLLGVALPNTPPYALSGQLERQGRIWRTTALAGRVGDSDLAGEVSIDTGKDRPFLRADLKSKRLDFDDLAAVFGGAPARAEGETVSAEQARIGQRMAAEQRIFPDAPLDLTRIRAMDADVTYEAASIQAPKLPLRAASLHLTLASGLLTADRLRVDLPRGAISGAATLDARQATPLTSIDLRLTDARLESLIPVRGDGPAPLTGSVMGRLRLTGAGASVHEAVSHANGEAVVAVPQGEIREAFAELLGVDVVKGLGLLLTKDQGKTEVRCAVAHFEARDGVLTADHIVFDTDPVLATGSGTVNLGEETLNLKLQGEPKDPQLLRIVAPVTLKGRLASPKLGLRSGGAATQGGVAAALAALAPLAAILPFVNVGTAEDAPCGALLAEARRAGAPAKSAD